MATHIQGAATLKSPANARPQVTVVRDEPSRVMHYVLFAGVMAILLFAPLAFGAVQDWAIAVLETSAALLFIAWAIAQTASQKLEIVSNPLYLPIAVFGLLVLVQITFGLSGYAYATWTEALKYVAYGLMFFITLQCVRTERQLKHFAWITTVYGFLLALFAIVQQFTWNGKVYWLRTVPSAYGPYINYNHYAGLMELLVPIPLVLSFNGRMESGKRVVLGFIAAIMATSIFLSGSRSGMIAFLVEAIFFTACLYAQRRGRRPALLLGVALIATFALIIWLGGDQIAARISTIQEQAQLEQKAGRGKILLDSLHMFKERPIAGWGLGVFPFVYPQFRSFYTDLFVNEAHNDYLQVLLEMGAAGFLVVVWFLVGLYRQGLRRWNRESHLSAMLRLAALAGCTGILAHSFTDFNLHIPANAAWYFVMCAVATRPLAVIKHNRSAV